jgi:hypothetical protein
VDDKAQSIGSSRPDSNASLSFEELAHQQGVSPIGDFEILLGEPMPDDESPFSTNDCTPRLTRLIPDRTQCRACSPSIAPGAASMVASIQGRPGTASSTARRSSAARLLGVPPPR